MNGNTFVSPLQNAAAMSCRKAAPHTPFLKVFARHWRVRRGFRRHVRADSIGEAWKEAFGNAVFTAFALAVKTFPEGPIGRNVTVAGGFAVAFQIHRFGAAASRWFPKKAQRRPAPRRAALA